MACKNCSDCPNGGDKENLAFTGGFANSEGFGPFVDFLGGLSLEDERDDDLLWELAAGSVVLDPLEPLSVWEEKVRSKFMSLKSKLG
jgi:hypothetical protein